MPPCRLRPNRYNSEQFTYDIGRYRYRYEFIYIKTVCVCVCACVRACVRAYVCVCVCVCLSVSLPGKLFIHFNLRGYDKITFFYFYKAHFSSIFSSDKIILSVSLLGHIFIHFDLCQDHTFCLSI